MTIKFHAAGYCNEDRTAAVVTFDGGDPRIRETNVACSAQNRPEIWAALKASRFAIAPFVPPVSDRSDA